MYGTKHWIATTLAAALLITPATLGARAQETTGDAPAVFQPAPTSAAPESAPVTDSDPAPSPADATAPADPLADAAMAGVHDALTVLPAAVRAALSPGDLREALLAATLRAADPRAEIGVAEAAPLLWDSGLLLVGNEDAPIVAHVIPDSAASEAGIHAGDRLEEIAGAPAPKGYDIAAASVSLRTGEDAALPLKVRPADGSDPREIELARRPIADTATSERLPTGIGYIRFPRVGDGTGASIADALALWTGDAAVSGIILDLRSADGAPLAPDAIRDACAPFALPGKILYRVDPDSPSAITVAAPALADRCRLPLTVLVDEATTGAAELLAAALRSGAESALLIGRPTAGDPLLRENRTLPGGRPVRLAVHILEAADGTRYDGRTGVLPTLSIPDRALDEKPYEPAEPVLRKGKTLSDEEKEDRALRDRTRHDPYLRRATDVLLGIQALGREWR